MCGCASLRDLLRSSLHSVLHDIPNDVLGRYLKSATYIPILHATQGTMLDPLSSLSLASTLITFVDFGVKLISNAREIHRSATSSSHQDLETTTNHLRHICSELDAGQQHVTEASAQALTALTQKCRSLAQDLLSALQVLHIQDGHRKWESFKAALRGVWAADRINDFQFRLSQYRQEILMQLQIIFK